MTLVRYQPKAMCNWSPSSRRTPIWGNWDRLMDQFVERRPDQNLSWTPRVDVREDEQSYHVAVDLPGLSKDDIRVTMDDDVLTIEGERKKENHDDGKQVHRRERFWGKFTRAMSFPGDVDAEQIKARFDNGVLHLELAKTEQAKPKQIEIN